MQDEPEVARANRKASMMAEVSVAAAKVTEFVQTQWDITQDKEMALAATALISAAAFLVARRGNNIVAVMNSATELGDILVLQTLLEFKSK